MLNLIMYHLYALESFLILAEDDSKQTICDSEKNT